MKHPTLLPLLLALALLPACHSSSSSGDDDDADTGTGSDTDTDTDTDADTDTLECSTSFPSEPIEWSLPTVPDPFEDWDPFTFWGGFAPCDFSEGSWHFSTFDLVGQSPATLVVLAACDDAGVGTDHWNVYANQGDGFADTPTEWDLPDAPDLLDAPFGTMWEANNPTPCEGNEFHFGSVLRRMDDDDALDILVTDFCDDGDVGESHWLVYRSTGDGFEAVPQSWSLPPAPELSADVPWEPFASLHYQSLPCATSGSFRFRVEDITGDGFVDLLITDHCDAAGVGDAYIEVHPGSAAGFDATPVEWTLPDFSALGSDYFDEHYNGNGLLTLVDLDGDDLPELLQASDGVPGGVGTEHWNVYRSTGSGFEAEPEAWSLPPTGMTSDTYNTFWRGSTNCGEATWSYLAKYDLNGDGLLDMLISDDCEIGGVGETHWIVYAGTGSGYQTTGQALCLPEPVVEPINSDPFSLSTNTSCEEGTTYYRHDARDIDGDGCADLHIMDDCEVGGIGDTHWLIYLNPCENVF